MMDQVDDGPTIIIKSLEKTDPVEIVQCSRRAFSDYFVNFAQVPDDYFISRWRMAQVNYKYSFAAFVKNIDDNDDTSSSSTANLTMIAFVVIGIDGNLAYNCITGVVPEYRGRRLVQRIYQHAIPILTSELKIEQIQLEVISINEKAIKAYTTSGFSIHRSLASVKGDLKNLNSGNINVDDVKVIQGEDILSIIKDIPEMLYTPQWEGKMECLKTDIQGLEYRFIDNKDKKSKSFLLVKKQLGLISQYRFDSEQDAYQLLQSLRNDYYDKDPSFKCITIDTRDPSNPIQIFNQFNLQQSFTQFEMIIKL